MNTFMYAATDNFYLNFELLAALCKRAESCELEAEAPSINPTLLPVLEDLLIELYAILRPKPDDYEQRHLMIDVFNKIAEEIYGKSYISSVIMGLWIMLSKYALLIIVIADYAWKYNMRVAKDAFSCNSYTYAIREIHLQFNNSVNRVLNTCSYDSYASAFSKICFFCAPQLWIADT